MSSGRLGQKGLRQARGVGTLGFTAASPSRTRVQLHHFAPGFRVGERRRLLVLSRLGLMSDSRGLNRRSERKMRRLAESIGVYLAIR